MAAALVLLAIQALAALLFLQHNRAAIAFPYPLDYGEGPVLDQVLRLARFEPIYRPDLSQPPYTITNYPPLFQLLQVPFAWIFGPAFWYGRAISTLSIIVAAVCVGLTIAWLTHNRLAGAIAGLMLPVFPYIVHWSAFNRVDSLALGLSCAGLYVLVRWVDRSWGVPLAGCLLVAAIFTRQSYGLAAPLAAFVWLLSQPPRRRVLPFALIVGGLSLGVFAVLMLLTRGGFFTHIVTANVNPFYIEAVLFSAREIRDFMPLMVACAALVLVAGFWFQPRAWWLVGPYLVGALASAATIGKAGSNVNYLFELMVAFSMSIGVLIAWSGRRGWVQALLLLLLTLQVAMIMVLTIEGYVPRVFSKLDQHSEIAQMAELVRASEGRVLADEYMGLVPLAGKSLYYQPFEMKQLADAGLWRQQPLLEAIDNRTFALILLYEPPTWDSRRERWTSPLLGAIERAYERGETLADTAVYRPAP